MIRILHIVGSLANGGMESFVLNLYRQINRHEIQFDFIVGSRNGWCEAYAKEIAEKGGRVFYIPTNLKGMVMFYEFLRKNKEYRIIHSHRDAMSTFFLTIALVAGIPLRISHSHSAGAKGIAKRIATRLLRPVLNYVATDRWACGQNAGEFLFGKLPFKIIPNGIDLNVYKYNYKVSLKKRAELGLPSDALVVGHVGRFEYEKNHDFLLDIYKEIYNLNDNVRLLLIGSGSLKAHIQKRIIEENVSGVLFLEKRVDINELLMLMDIVVFPSHYEGFSMAMVEMQASGIPVLCSDSVPREINLTGLVHFKSLNDSAESWANELIKQHGVDRLNSDTFRVLKNAGLDVHDSSQMVQNEYLRMYNRVVS